MNTAYTLPEHLSEVQRKAIADLIERVEFLPISCLFYRANEHRVISPNRTIVDDFIYLPSKGRLSCIVEGEKKDIGPGEFMMVTAGEKHGVTMAEGIDSYEVYALHMHLYDASRYRYLKKMDSHYGALPDFDGWVRRLAACTCLMGRDPKAGGAYMKQVVMDLLIEQLLLGYKLRELPVNTDQRITRLQAGVRRSPADPWTVTRMAKLCNLSVSRFRELFTGTTGTSPKKYLQKVRLSLARSLLMTDPSLTVEQVADKVGIPDAHYFHAIYRDHFGETPKNRSLYRTE